LYVSGIYIVLTLLYCTLYGSCATVTSNETFYLLAYLYRSRQRTFMLL